MNTLDSTVYMVAGNIFQSSTIRLTNSLTLVLTNLNGKIRAKIFNLDNSRSKLPESHLMERIILTRGQIRRIDWILNFSKLLLYYIPIVRISLPWFNFHQYVRNFKFVDLFQRENSSSRPVFSPRVFLDIIL